MSGYKIIDEPPKFIKHGEEMVKRFQSCPILHDQQKQALKNLAQWFKDDKTKDKTAVVCMPTGSGKSGIMCCLPYYLGGSEIPCIDFKKKILIIAPSLCIRDQLEADLMVDPFLVRLQCITETEKMALEYAVFTLKKTDEVEKLRSYNAFDIVLTNAQKWRVTNGIPNYENLPEDLFSLIIVDEAHHLPSKQWQEIINKFRKNAKVVFFTATPYRADKKDITADGALKDVGFAYKLSREEAIRDKLIRDVTFTEVTESTDLMQTKKPKYDENSKDGKKLKRIEKISPYVSAVLQQVRERMEEKNKKYPLPGGKKHASLIIAYDIIEAEMVEVICRKLTFPPEAVLVINSNKNKSWNEKCIKGIKEGKYQVVIIVQMLLEGFDYPPFSVAGIVTKIVSLVKFSQFVGRVQRVVRQPYIEENIVANVITHECFKQKKLIDKYGNPVIPEEEDKLLDAENELYTMLL